MKERMTQRLQPFNGIRAVDASSLLSDSGSRIEVKRDASTESFILTMEFWRSLLAVDGGN